MLDEAVDLLRAARQSQVHYRPWYAWTCYELGEALLGRSTAPGTSVAAPNAIAETRALWEEALGLAREMHMPPLEKRVAARLEKLQVSLAPASVPTLPCGLSPREAEVLWLLAAGKTNKEIAFGLGISEKNRGQPP